MRSLHDLPYNGNLPGDCRTRDIDRDTGCCARCGDELHRANTSCFDSRFCQRCDGAYVENDQGDWIIDEMRL